MILHRQRADAQNHPDLDVALADVDPGVKLVCVTKRDAFLERLLAQAENVGIRNRLIITGWVGDEDLKILFNQAEALVFPSLSFK